MKKRHSDRLLNIGELVECANLAVAQLERELDVSVERFSKESVRHANRLGILPEPPMPVGANTVRRYPANYVDRLVAVRRIQVALSKRNLRRGQKGLPEVARILSLLSAERIAAIAEGSEPVHLDKVWVTDGEVAEERRRHGTSSVAEARAVMDLDLATRGKSWRTAALGHRVRIQVQGPCSQEQEHQLSVITQLLEQALK